MAEPCAIACTSSRSRIGTVADYAATLEAGPRVAADRRRLPADGGRRLRARAAAGKLSSDAEIAGRALPPHAQGDPLGPRLVPLGLPGRVQAAVARRRGRADPPRRDRLPDQPGRPDRRQRPPDAARRAGTRSTWSGPARTPRRSSPATTWPTGWSTRIIDLGRRRATGSGSPQPITRHPTPHDRTRRPARARRRTETAGRRPNPAERIYFPELDGLRFIAFMMVYLFHGGVPQGMLRQADRHARPRRALQRERRIRRPALLHPERLPDHDAPAPRGGPVRPHRAPRVLDPAHPADLAAVLPDRRDRLLV